MLTALLLKVALEVVAGLTLWVIAAGSKLVVLWLVDLVFGDEVSLGGFIPVTLLVVALLAARAAVRRLLEDQPRSADRSGSTDGALGSDVG